MIQDHEKQHTHAEFNRLHTVNMKRYDTDTGETKPVVSVLLTVKRYISQISVAWSALLRGSIAYLWGSITQFYDKNQ